MIQTSAAAPSGPMIWRASPSLHASPGAWLNAMRNIITSVLPGALANGQRHADLAGLLAGDE
jgi:hypothetical protein